MYPPKGPLSKAWVEGPFCPKCKRELDEIKTGPLRKKPAWVCPNCKKEYEKPRGNPIEEVRKDFEAYLRRKGKL